jgi:alkylhydroperoxidase family enzyme
MAEVSGSGMVAKIVQIFSLRPASMRRMIRQWELTIKEMIDRLRQKGYDDTGILDLTIAVADAHMRLNL